MTLIEFFDDNHLENVYSCLAADPERVILLGAVNKSEKAIVGYKKVFEGREKNIEFITKYLPAGFLDAANVLSEIVEENDNCVFDITGGSEVALTALGAVYERYKQKDKNIQIHRYNFNNNKLYDCDGDNQVVWDGEDLSLTVEENVRIYGGDVIYEDSDGDVFTFLWDMNEAFEADVDRMWRIAQKNQREWNKQINIFEAVSECGVTNGLETTVSWDVLSHHLQRNKIPDVRIWGIINALEKAGLMKLFEDDEVVSLKFKDAQVKRCLTKAGQVLEMKIYKEMKNLRDKHGSFVFSDVMNGVQIDWDGALDENGESGDTETKNEIDVLAIKNATPVFVSCKNGSFEADELYKLKTVSGRFGGRYAKMVIAATSIPETLKKNQILRQRIKDMKIALIDITKDSSDEEIRRALLNLAK